MREMPAEVRELLKSRSMIGENKPSYEVTVSTLSAGSYDWEKANAWYQPSTTIEGDLTVAKKTNGKLICVISQPGIFYEGECSLEDLISKDDSVLTWSQINIISNGFCAVSRVGDKLYLCVTDTGIKDVREASTKLYVSESGNGGDWQYYSTITSVTRNYTEGYGLERNGAGCITFLSNGRWVIPCGKFIHGSYSSVFIQQFWVFSSDNNGITWTERLRMTGGFNVNYNASMYGQDCPKHVTVTKNGYLYIAHAVDYNGIYIRISRSIDNGINWDRILDISTGDWGGATWWIDFELISNESGGLYLYCNGYLGDSPTSRIYEISEPINSPSNKIIIKNLPLASIGDCTNPTMQMIDNKLIITKKNYVLGVNSIKSKLPVKSISINRNKNMAGSLNLTIDNKNGEWSPDNTVNQNVLFPNTEVTVKQGYGAELVQTFSGMIDRIEMSTFSQSISLSVRDKLKLALDQTISPQVIKYTEQTVEDIFIDLAGKAGLTVGTVETIGLTIAEKTFSWETYADCFSWIADLVGFEFGCDEEGKVYFKKDAIPSATDWILTFTDGTAQAYFPIVENSEVLKSADGLTTYVKDTDYTIDYDTGELTSLTILDGETLMSYVFAVYTFKEGEDIISLGYTIDDNDIYSKVVVYGKNENDEVISAYKDYVSKDYYNVLSQKIMKIDVSEVSTVEQLQAIADRAEMLMRSRVRTVRFAAVAVPWLQVGDLIQVVESSTTISELYRVTDLSTNMDDGGYTMQITCYHHSA